MIGSSDFSQLFQLSDDTMHKGKEGGFLSLLMEHSDYIVSCETTTLRFQRADNLFQTGPVCVDLMSCKVCEKYIFKEGWLAQPSSVTSSTERTAPQKELFDLQGRRIQGEPKHGVYIQNGKKVMR